VSDQIDGAPIWIYVNINPPLVQRDDIKIRSGHVRIDWDPFLDCLLKFDRVLVELGLQGHHVITGEPEPNWVSCFRFHHKNCPRHFAADIKSEPALEDGTDFFGERRPSTGN
jgi:hypothetical protein